MSKNSYSQHVLAAVAAAKAANDVLMARFRIGVSNLSESGKSQLGHWLRRQTSSRIACSTDALANSGCGGVIISEESNVDLGACSNSTDKVEWLIDPLCGTVPFSTGMNHCGVNIAMRAEGEFAVSALAVPASATLITASNDGVARANGEKLEASFPNRDLSEVAVGLEIDGQAQRRKLLETGGLNWVTRVSQANGFSSAAYPLMLVVTGSYVVGGFLQDRTDAFGRRRASRHVVGGQGNRRPWR